MKMKEELSPKTTADAKEASSAVETIVMLPVQEKAPHYCEKAKWVEKGVLDSEGHSIDEIRCAKQCFWCK